MEGVVQEASQAIAVSKRSCRTLRSIRHHTLLFEVRCYGSQPGNVDTALTRHEASTSPLCELTFLRVATTTFAASLHAEDSLCKSSRPSSRHNRVIIAVGFRTKRASKIRSSFTTPGMPRFAVPLHLPSQPSTCGTQASHRRMIKLNWAPAPETVGLSAMPSPIREPPVSGRDFRGCSSTTANATSRGPSQPIRVPKSGTVPKWSPRSAVAWRPSGLTIFHSSQPSLRPRPLLPLTLAQGPEMLQGRQQPSTTLASGSPWLITILWCSAAPSMRTSRTSPAPTTFCRCPVAHRSAATAWWSWVTKKIPDKRYIVRNSWGTNWGQNGYCEVPYAYLEDGSQAGDFWVLSSAE